MYNSRDTFVILAKGTVWPHEFQKGITCLTLVQMSCFQKHWKANPQDWGAATSSIASWLGLDLHVGQGHGHGQSLKGQRWSSLWYWHPVFSRMAEAFTTYITYTSGTVSYFGYRMLQMWACVIYLAKQVFNLAKGNLSG
jgi:hypothetical protein